MAPGDPARVSGCGPRADRGGCRRSWWLCRSERPHGNRSARGLLRRNSANGCGIVSRAERRERRCRALRELSGGAFALREDFADAADFRANSAELFLDVLVA